MTPSEARELAYAFLGEFGITVNNIPHAILYNRMSARQRELFTWAGTIDPEFYGECIVALLDAGGANLKTLEEVEGIYPIEAIQIVRVHDVGTNEDYTMGDRVRLVRADDTRELPPRMTLRDKVLRGVGTDLDGVGSVRIWYSRRPRPIELDGTGNIEIQHPFDTLLSYDLAKFIMSRDPETASATVIGILTERETAMIASFEAHIRNSYRALEARFG